MSDDRTGEHFSSLNPINSLLDEMFGRTYTRFCPVNVWRPDVNLYEVDAGYVVCVDLAGMKKPDFEVGVQSNVLIIQGRRARPTPETEGVRVHLMEINDGAFRREIEIPTGVEDNDIQAEYREGFLWITLPRKSEDRT